MGNLIFNSISAEDLGLVIQAPPAYTFPAKDLSTTHVPGRNGDLILDNYCYNNVDRVYSIASVFRPGTNFIANSEKIIRWLTAPSGYCRLEDSYDPLVYRMAMFSANGSLTNYYDQATAISVTFNCKPQRFLKIGEKKLEYSGSDITIKNPTSEAALPLITVSGMPQTSDADILLMTVSNVDTGTVYSSITISKLPNDEDSITIDSEEQLAYYENQNGDKKDRNAYLNFNGTDFPKFAAGTSKITVAKYVQSSCMVDKYDSIITNYEGYNICSAKYLPFESINDSRQESFAVKKYNNIKLNKEEVYDAKAYLNLCADKADTYTFKSYNTILSENGDVAAFIGQDSTVPEWLEIVYEEGDSELTCKLKACEYTEKYGYGYIMDSSNDKRIRCLKVGDTIGTYKTTAVVNINFYPAMVDDSGNPVLAAEYADLPDWLTYEVTYTSDRSPDKVFYKIRSTFADGDESRSGKNTFGYYYTEKTGLFGKAKWNRKNEVDGNDQPYEVELGSATWSTWKKAFATVSNFSPSTSATFTYKWLYEAPQYDDVTEETTDSDGNKVTEVISKVHFTIFPISDDLTKINVKVKSDSAGYYRSNDDGLDAFEQYSADALIRFGESKTTSYDSTKALTLYYLSTIPDYSSEKGYPNWLQTGIYDSDGNPAGINPSSINFVLAKDAWYRRSYTEDDKTVTTNWAWATAGQLWNINLAADKTCTLHMITKENKLDERLSYTDPNGNIIYDIGFYDKNGTLLPNNIPPSWLRVELETVGTTKLIKFTSASYGYFKWDSGLVWMEKTPEVELVSSELTDDTTIYFMEKLPSYSFVTPVHMEVVQAADTGNPTMVNIMASSGGYYKLSTASDWTYYSENSKIGEAKVSESVTIDYLTSSAISDDIKINIIPRWWLL